jgi:hypothetical protein
MWIERFYSFFFYKLQTINLQKYPLKLKNLIKNLYIYIYIYIYNIQDIFILFINNMDSQSDELKIRWL